MTSVLLTMVFVGCGLWLATNLADGVCVDLSVDGTSLSGYETRRSENLA